MSTVKIGDTLTSFPFPPEVVAVRDVDGDWWQSNDKGCWHMGGDPMCSHGDPRSFSPNYGPWTVDDLREPEPPAEVVLTLPEVPANAWLHGLSTGDRYERRGEEWTSQAWTGRLHELLYHEPEGVRIKLAPPREPRTWARIEPEGDDVAAFRGASGTVYRYAMASRGSGLRLYSAGAIGRPLSSWAQLDGPLTEVIEDAPSA